MQFSFAGSNAKTQHFHCGGGLSSLCPCFGKALFELVIQTHTLA